MLHLPPEYDGETAFSNGSIDTSEDTGTGRDGRSSLSLVCIRIMVRALAQVILKVLMLVEITGHG